MPPRITIGLVTDLHYAPMTVGNRYCGESLSKLRAGVTTLQTRNVDLLVCLGDVIDKSETVEKEIVRVREVADTLARLPVDHHFVLGNHDVSELTKDQFLAACEAEATYYSFDFKGVHLIILDSNFNPDGESFAPGNFCWNNAWIGTEQLAWLETDLAAAGDSPTLVFCHANLDSRFRKDGQLNGHVVKDAPKVRTILETSGIVKAVIQGHDHGGQQSVIHGIPYITLRAMVEGSGLAQNAFSVLSLTQGGDIILEGFGQQPSMRFANMENKEALCHE